MSLHRILTIVRKDTAWALGNLKLLGIMILPVFVVVFFSRLDSASTFGFALIFVNAFVGIFSTSYLVIEEKNKGTLLSLLTSPLTGAELLFGKFFYNLILCSFFSLLVILMNNRLDLLTQPLALLNILLFAGTTCFVGFVTGVYFKNEQEMSVLAPFLMLLFCFGDAAEKTSEKNNIHSFFPDYHISQSVRDIPLVSQDLFLNSIFSLILFLIAFLMASFYTRFYFSNNREKRFSIRLVGFVSLFFVTLITSGFIANRHSQAEQAYGDWQSYQFETPSLKTKFKYNSKVLRRKTLLQSRKKSMELLSFIDEKDSNIVFAIRDLEADEKNLEMREEKIKTDSQRQLISMEDLADEKLEFRQWTYVKRDSFILLREKFCGEQIFQYSMDLKLKKMERLNKDLEVFDNIFKTVEMECL